MLNGKESALRNFFAKRAGNVGKEVAENVDENVDEIVAENVAENVIANNSFDVKNFFNELDKKGAEEVKCFNGDQLNFDEIKFEDVSFLDFEDACEIKAQEVVEMYKIAESHCYNFSRLEWYAFITKTAQAVINLCCQIMKIDPKIIKLRYYCSNSVLEKVTENGDEDFSTDGRLQNSAVAFALMEIGKDGVPRYSLNINVDSPMRSSVGYYPEIFATLFHEMWHLKEYYDGQQEYLEMAEEQKNFVENVVDSVKELKAKGLSLDEIERELKKKGMPVALESVDDDEGIVLDDGDEFGVEFDDEKDGFRSRFERCVDYSNDALTWSANPGERRADAFGYAMLRAIMDEADENPVQKRIFNKAGRMSTLHHLFSSGYVPVRAFFRALFNVNVPEKREAEDAATLGGLAAKYVRLASIEHAGKNNKPLMWTKGFEKREVYDYIDDSNLGNWEEIKDEFFKRNFRTVKKIVEADNYFDNVERLEKQFEKVSEEDFVL